MYVGYTFFAVNLDAWYFYLFLIHVKGDAPNFSI